MRFWDRLLGRSNGNGETHDLLRDLLTETDAMKQEADVSEREAWRVVNARRHERGDAPLDPRAMRQQPSLARALLLARDGGRDSRV